MLGSFDCAIAAFDVLVVFLDRFLSDIARVEIVVVQVRHHLRGDPHGATVVDPLLCVQHCHDQQRNRRAQAVLEVRVAYACVEKHLATFFDPRTVIEIAWIELLEQELVPGVTALIHRTRRRSLSARLGLRLSLPTQRNRRLRPLLCDGRTGCHQSNHRDCNDCDRSLHGRVLTPYPRRAKRVVAANSGVLNRRFAPADSSTDSSSRGYNFGSKFGKVTSRGGRTCNNWCNVPRVSSVIRISICPLGRFLMCSSSARVSRSSLSVARSVASYFS